MLRWLVFVAASSELGERSLAFWEGVVVEVVVCTGGMGCHTPTSVPFPNAWMALPTEKPDSVLDYYTNVALREEIERESIDFSTFCCVSGGSGKDLLKFGVSV